MQYLTDFIMGKGGKWIGNVTSEKIKKLAKLS